MSDVVIIGAGLAGLSCALSLQASGVAVAVVEASDRPGGRVSTDLVEGFLLDRGFQVLLTAYPEAQRLLGIPPAAASLRSSAKLARASVADQILDMATLLSDSINVRLMCTIPFFVWLQATLSLASAWEPRRREVHRAFRTAP